MTEQRFDPRRITTEAAPKAVPRRSQPISTVRLQGSVSTLYTASDAYDFMIRHIWAANIGSTGHEITVYLVPSGGTAGDGTAICKGYPIAANTTVRLDFLSGTNFGSLLQPGMTLQAVADTPDVVNMGGWGQDVIGDGI